MTRGEIWKDFFKRTVFPAVIALFLFFMFKNVFTEDGQTNYFYVWLCCGIPFGIRRMFVWLVPHGYRRPQLYFGRHYRRGHFDMAACRGYMVYPPYDISFTYRR